MKHFDYIFAGAGLSGLMTVYKMVQSGKFDGKSILLIDQNPKKTNDRTWCFWEKPNHDWENCVSKKWEKAFFANQDRVLLVEFKPYQYNMIRGLDFYNTAFEVIANAKNCTFLIDSIISYEEKDNIVSVKTASETFSCSKYFNSIYDPEILKKQSKYPVLQQHFIGWFIKTDTPVFDENVATFMDFSISENKSTKFMYVLPFSKTEALLEPTLFSHHLLRKEEYEAEIEAYTKKLGIKNFTITEKEQGSIPMTCFQFWKKSTTNVLHIGTAGGWTKASTGYTFFNTNKKTDALLSFLGRESDLSKFHKKTRFWYYDLILLEVLDKRNELGPAIFSGLFENKNPKLIFKFLNEETNFFEELKVMSSCPTFLFMKAVLRLIFR